MSTIESTIVIVDKMIGNDSTENCGINPNNVILWFPDGEGKTVVETIKGSVIVDESYDSFNNKMKNAK